MKQRLKKRMKLIKMADNSPNGWHTVAEYLSDDLAENSDDDRKIKKAETKAEAKRKRFSQTVQAPKRPRYEATFEQRYSQYPSRPSTSRQFFRGSRYPGPRDRCYGCGKSGHWRSACPTAPQQDSQPAITAPPALKH